MLSEYDLIIIDPIYQFYDDAWVENDNSDMSKLGRILRAIAEMTGISVIFAHHHTKGNQDGKREIEKAAGGGFSRFVAACVAITLKDEELQKYEIGWTTTHFAPQPKVVAYRENFGWRITDEKPSAKPTFTVDQIMSVLDSHGMSSEEWFRVCVENFTGMKQADFEALRAKARKQNLVTLDGSTKIWSPTKLGVARQQGVRIYTESEESAE